MTHATHLAPDRFFPVRLEALGSKADALDLYLWHEQTGGPVLYRSRGVAFTEHDRRTLVANGVSRLYAPLDQHATYRRLLVDRLERLLDEAASGSARSVDGAREACAESVEDVMHAPGAVQPVLAVRDLGAHLASRAWRDRSTLERLLDLGARDFATPSHMVNVGVGCGLLAQELAPGDDQLTLDCILGGFLHDLGKRGVPESVLLKEGRLSDQEWRLIRRHPTIGYDELAAHEVLPDAALDIVRDHHERVDGTGYPRRIPSDQLSLAAKIGAVVDAYDAVASQRPYRSGIDPLATLALMSDGTGTIFDQDALRAWTRIVRRLVRQDPARAALARASEKAALPSLHHLMPRPLSHGERAASESESPVGKDDRRRFARHSCRAHVRAMFLHQGKAGPVLPGETFELRTLDVGKGGVLMEAPWAFSLGDVLVLDLPQGASRSLRLHARVVRVRRRGEAAWAIGLRFIAETELLGGGDVGQGAHCKQAS